MTFLLLVVSLVLFLLTASLNAELLRGDACTFIPSGEVGVCQPLGGCFTARASLRAGNEPQRCGFEGSTPIICCTTGSQLPPYGLMTAPATIKPVNPVINRNREQAPYPKIGGTCPPLPEAAVTVEKTGQKAWDYCIDLAYNVYPCTTDGFSIIRRYIRINECAHLSTPLVIGGNKTEPGEFPHMAALGYDSDVGIDWGCGGSLISNRWVLTAAHCVRTTRKVNHVRLGGGDNDSPLDSKTHFTVIEEKVHEDYTTSQSYNDIALLKLDRDVKFYGTIRPACLHTGNIVKDDKALVSGWGVTTQHGKQSNSLLKTTVEKFSLRDCQQTNPPQKRKLKHGVNDAIQFCFGHNTLKQDTCQGDSGGPLMISNTNNVYCTFLVIGITSNGKICGEPGFPAIYTRVSAFVPWIERIVWP